MSQALRAHYVVFLLLPRLAVAQQPLSRVTLGILTSVGVVSPLPHSSMQQPPEAHAGSVAPQGCIAEFLKRLGHTWDRARGCVDHDRSPTLRQAPTKLQRR
jgi:hypothetical protein